MRPFRRLRSLVVVLAALGAFAARAEQRVVVVKSDDLAPYSRVITGFSVEARYPVVELSLAGGDDAAVLEKLRALRPALVLAVGPRAANLCARQLAGTPVIFTMVPNWEKYGLTGGNVTGISLLRPVDAQLRTLQAVSGARRVGVLYNPKHSQGIIDAARKAASELGMSLVPAKVDGPEEVSRATRAFVGNVDAVWMIADRSTANVTAFRQIIAFSFEHKVPTFALSEGQVKEGALVSLAPNYAGIGQQAGRLAGRILQNGSQAGGIPVQPPEGLDIALNLTTARRIGVQCDLALEIFTFAAKQGYPIRVHE